MREFDEIRILELLEEGPDIIREMVTEFKRRDTQWGSRAYSRAVQWLRQVEDEQAHTGRH